MTSNIRILGPGPTAPNRPCPPAALARRLGVPVAALRSWMDDGMPAQDGLVDPIAAVSWLCAGRLAQCPVLERRFQAWSRWMADPRARTWRVRWRRSAYLPPGWTLIARPLGVEGAPDAADPLHGAALIARPAASMPPSDLVDLAREAADGFAYGYRRHAGDDLDPLPASPPRAGTCLDLAVALGVLLQRRGRPWRIRSGVVAGHGLTNPHAWIEAAGPAGSWIGVDPTLLAVSRMLGVDPRQVSCHAPGGTVVAQVAAIGSAPVHAINGTWHASRGRSVADATACSDWANGACDWTCTEVAG